MPRTVSLIDQYAFRPVGYEAELDGHFHRVTFRNAAIQRLGTSSFDDQCARIR
jgi:hypothetical protein